MSVTQRINLSVPIRVEIVTTIEVPGIPVHVEKQSAEIKTIEMSDDMNVWFVDGILTLERQY